MLVLKNCRFLVTQDEKRRVLENVDVTVENGVIVDICENAETAGHDVIDCSNHIVMPGLINTHTHAAMVMFRGLCDDKELREWLNYMWKLERYLNEDLVYKATKLACIEMLFSGTTAFLDMYYYPNSIVKAAKEVGLRVKVGYFPTSNLDYIVKMFKNNPHVIPYIIVHSIYAVPLEIVERAIQEAKRLDVDVSMHVSETRWEVYECKRRYGLFPVELLHNRGLLNDHLHLVHLGWVTSWELEYIRRCNVKVTTCPTSNMKLATAGHFPLKELLSMGVIVGLGTDGAASSNTLDMFREMKTCILLQRHSYWSTDIGVQDVLDMATLNGGKIFKLPIGRISPNYYADIICLNIKKPHIQPLRRDNLLPTLAYTVIGSDVDMVVVHGKILLSESNREQLLGEALDTASYLNHKIVDVLEKVKDSHLTHAERPPFNTYSH